MEEIIKKNQEKLIRILRGFDNKKPLSFLVQDSCSEISRLFGCWLLDDLPISKIDVLKGEGVFNDKNIAHDLLLVNYNDTFYLVDPTVWQFHKNKKNILVKKEKSLNKCFDYLNKTYGGVWSVSENITKSDCDGKNEWMDVIEKNISK